MSPRGKPAASVATPFSWNGPTTQTSASELSRCIRGGLCSPSLLKSSASRSNPAEWWWVRSPPPLPNENEDFAAYGTEFLDPWVYPLYSLHTFFTAPHSSPCQSWP